jgi:hypothetical protein
LATSASCLFSFSLQAADVDSTYAEARYIFDGEVEDLADFDGYCIGGSFHITDHIYATGLIDNN